MKKLLYILLFVIAQTISAQQYFNIGSSKNEVKKIMGNPQSVDSYSDIGLEVWRYGNNGLASVTFENGVVTEYNNYNNILKIGDNNPIKNKKNIDRKKTYTPEEIKAAKASLEETRREQQEAIIRGELQPSVFGTYSSNYARPPIDWDTYEDGKYKEVAEAQKWDDYVIPSDANQRLEDYKNKKLFNLIILLVIITVVLVAGYFIFFREKHTETTINAYKKKPSDLQSLKQNIDEVHNALFNSDEGNKALIEMANKGDYEAQYNLGTLYFKKQEFEKAKYWFEQSAINGDKDSQYQMGNLYLQGTGVEKDLNIAFSWYEKASNQEHPQSQHNLGLFYMQGEIVERNKEKALYWFNKAAGNGYEPSKHIISTFG